MSRIAEAAFGDRPYPESPGHKTGGTSRDAAKAVGAGAAEGREAVLAAFRAAGSAGLTADEAAASVGRKPGYVRPRCSELVAEGKLVKTGERRRNPDTGLSVAVWRAA